MNDKQKFASEVAKKLNWADIIGNIDNLKVEMLWRLYARHIFDGVEVGATQYAETKQAYYCGFTEAFKVLTDISVHYTEDQASDILTRLSKEGNSYIESLVERTLK